MSFFKDWATVFWVIAKVPVICLSVIAAGYWGTEALFKAVSYLQDSGVSGWTAMVLFILIASAISSLVLTVIFRRQK